MYPIGQIQEHLLEILATQETYLPTSDLSKKHYGGKYITNTDHGAIDQALRGLQRRAFVLGKKQNYQTKRKSRNGRNNRRSLRKIWVWKITPKGLEYVNGDSR